MASRGGSSHGMRVHVGLRGRRALHDQAGYRLAVRVQQPRDADRAGGPGDRQQRPRADQLEDLVPYRTGGQLPGQQGPPGLPSGDALFGLRQVVSGQEQPAAPLGAGVLQHEPGLVQPPVESVQPGALPGAAARRAPLGDDTERLREHVQHGGGGVAGVVLAARGGHSPGSCSFPVKLESPQVKRHKFIFSSGECYLQFTCPWYRSASGDRPGHAGRGENISRPGHGRLGAPAGDGRGAGGGGCPDRLRGRGAGREGRPRAPRRRYRPPPRCRPPPRGTLR